MAVRQSSQRASARVRLAGAGLCSGLLMLAGSPGMMSPASHTTRSSLPRLVAGTRSSRPPSTSKRAVVSVLVLITWWSVRRIHPDRPVLVRLATLGAAVYAVQVVVGGAQVLTRLAGWTQTLHVAFNIPQHSVELRCGHLTGTSSHTPDPLDLRVE